MKFGVSITCIYLQIINHGLALHVFICRLSIMGPEILLEHATDEDWVGEMTLLTRLLQKEETRVLNKVFDLDSVTVSECDDFLDSVRQRYGCCAIY